MQTSCRAAALAIRHPAHALRLLAAAAAITLALNAIYVVCGHIPESRAGSEQLLVPSQAMGRDIPITFLAGGPHTVYLLDAFNAPDTVSNWVTVGNAMNTLAGKGVSVVAPAGGAYSLYADWEHDGTRQWGTFLSEELPSWLAANKGTARGGHAVIGASQGGTAALSLAEFRPDRFRYAGSMSGFLTPSATFLNGAITQGLEQYGGVDSRNMWGPAQMGRWKSHDPASNMQLLIDNNTRLWIYSPQTVTASDPAAMIGYADQAQGSNRTFYAAYRSASGHNAHIDFPATGDHGWPSWGPQLSAMADDLASYIR
ncbi:alpha/beta hydrolase-fold protein [Mycobacteroides abscessus]|uniref:alpha/beta hydrolase-fold protein n=1 Tax=Mycobacteroides abscessus TaxID=36809 RepID=UPI000C2593A5|nr:alpha/beta hydrolase family protein [Mycobacteroides abscessus]